MLSEIQAGQFWIQQDTGETKVGSTALLQMTEHTTGVKQHSLPHSRTRQLMLLPV
jgi:hypothetical protein